MTHAEWGEGAVQRTTATRSRCCSRASATGRSASGWSSSAAYCVPTAPALSLRSGLDDTLLFLHVLAAFAMVSGVVIVTAGVLNVAVGVGPFAFGNRLLEIGATLTLVFGVWIVLRDDAYDITDGWILGAIGLWLVTAVVGGMANNSVEKGTTRFERRAATMHWFAVAATIGILVLMVWKPGA